MINYALRIYPDGEGESLYWIAEFPDLKDCIGTGGTAEEAIQDAMEAKEAWIEACNILGKPIPDPSDHYAAKYSGKFNLRLTKSLHRNLAIRAEEEGVSLNQLCLSYLAAGLEKTESQIAKQSLFQRVLFSEEKTNE